MKCRVTVDIPDGEGWVEATLAKELAGVIFVEPFRKQEDGSPGSALNGRGTPCPRLIHEIQQSQKANKVI